MIILQAKDFNAEWLQHRLFLCYLPTEIVVPYTKVYSGMGAIFDIPPIDCVYRYRLPDDAFPHKYVKIERGINYVGQSAIEVHSDWGTDGHTDYRFVNKFIVVYNDEIEDFTFTNYKKLIGEMYDYEERLRNPMEQLSFNNYLNGYEWDYLWS